MSPPLETEPRLLDVEVAPQIVAPKPYCFGRTRISVSSWIEPFPSTFLNAFPDRQS